MISSVKVEKFEPFGKAFCSQHPFAGPGSLGDSRSNQESKNDSVSGGAKLILNALNV